MENWEVHHRGAVPLGAPALQHFGGGIRAQGDPAAAARLLSHVGSAPEEVRHPPDAHACSMQSGFGARRRGGPCLIHRRRQPGSFSAAKAALAAASCRACRCLS